AKAGRKARVRGRPAQRRAQGPNARPVDALPQLWQLCRNPGRARPHGLEAGRMNVASLCGPTCGAQLFVHVLGATTLFGMVLAVTILAYAALRLAPERAALLRRVGFWTTVALMLPAWLVMYFGGYWLLGHEGLDHDTPGWANAGARIADVGAALLIALLVIGWLAIKRPRLGVWVAAVATLYLVALAVAWFFMSGKPSI